MFFNFFIIDWISFDLFLMLILEKMYALILVFSIKTSYSFKLSCFPKF